MTCTVYEVWDRRGRLVYVGIADSFPHRWAQHRRASWWLGEVEVEHVELRTVATREAARMIEAATINEQSPVYNTSRESAAYARALAFVPPDDGPNPLRALSVERIDFLPGRAS